jgi:4-amino-4-deoxy-L-arabinose transferase-like glycosyltransferase
LFGHHTVVEMTSTPLIPKSAPELVQDSRPAQFVRSARTFRLFILGTGAILLAAFSCLLYLPVAIHFLPIDPDYFNHIRFAKEIYQTHHLVVPQFLFHLLIIGLFKLTGATFETDALWVVAGSFALTGGLVYREAAHALMPADGSRAALVGGAAAAFALAAAILLMQPLLKPGLHQYQIGYLWAEPYLSPTYLLLKPLALASAIIAVTLITRTNAPRMAVIGAAITTAAATLAKPNFAICLLPAACIFGAVRLWSGNVVDWKAIILGLLIPTAAVLAMQYYLSYSSFGPQSTYHNAVVFAPFKAIGRFGGYLSIKFVFSTAFPLAVYGLYWKSAVRNARLNFAVLLFAFGCGYSYLLAEKQNWEHGNFIWSGYITLFILFVFSATFFFRELKTASWRGKEALRHCVPLVLLLLHVRSGILVEIATLHQK